MLPQAHKQKGERHSSGAVLVIRAPAYSLAKAAWVPRLLVRRDDGTFWHREGALCEIWAAAMAESWKLASSERRERTKT